MSRKAVDYEQFIHPWDRNALNALKKIPLLDTVLKKYNEFVNERLRMQFNDATMVRLGPTQLPKIYDMLVEVSEKLGIKTPRLYLRQGSINAYTSGETNPFIVLYSGALFAFTDEEIKGTLAHECGHILCHHVHYHQLAEFILSKSAFYFGIPSAVMFPLECALFHWIRCSEFSADRVSAYCVEDANIVARQMQVFAGGFLVPSRFQINSEAFLRQNSDYEEQVDDSLVSKAIHFYMMKNQLHPFPAKRASEITRWYESVRDSLPPFANSDPSSMDEEDIDSGNNAW